MSSGPETRFIASVQKHLPAVDEFYRMKNHTQYNAGIADSWYDGSRRDLWVEWKWVELPKQPDTIIDVMAGKKPSLSKLQQDWIEGRRANGRNVWIIIGCKEGGVLYSHSQMPVAVRTADFVSRCHPRAQLASFIDLFCNGP
jgi:hypothetical protein